VLKLGAWSGFRVAAFRGRWLRVRDARGMYFGASMGFAMALRGMGGNGGCVGGAA